jgi:16S rRNA C1402 N4-methylase RsmH
MWNAPDGTRIVAFERTDFKQGGQLAVVSFHSKESPEIPQQTTPNPYKQ